MNSPFQRLIIPVAFISALVGCSSNVINEKQVGKMQTMESLYYQYAATQQQDLSEVRSQAPMPVSASTSVSGQAPSTHRHAKLANPTVELHVYEHLAEVGHGEVVRIPSYTTAFDFYPNAPFALAHEVG